IAQERWDLAQKDLDEFFARADKKVLDYAEWADGSLIQGLLLERQGKKEAAQATWRKGLLREWPGGLPTLPGGRLLSGIAATNRSNAITFDAILASITGELTEDETDFLYRNLISSAGATDKIAGMVGKKAFPIPFVRQVILRAYTSPRGRE